MRRVRVQRRAMSCPLAVPRGAGIADHEGAASRREDRGWLQENLQGSGRQEGGGSQVLVRSGAYAARALRMAQSLRALCDVDARAPCDCLVAGARRQALLRKSRRARVAVCGARIVLGGNDSNLRSGVTKVPLKFGGAVDVPKWHQPPLPPLILTRRVFRASAIGGIITPWGPGAY